MNNAATTTANDDAGIRSGAAARRMIDWGTALALVMLAAMIVVMAFLVWVAKPYKPGSPLGYNLGLIGGLSMLSLFVYPLRKRLPLLQRLGGMLTWFRYHMILGIGGPLLILFHSTFATASMNGAVALYAMLVVVASGMVGRFVYRHVHQGLYGRLLTLTDADKQLKAGIENAQGKLAQYQDVAHQLDAFRARAFAPAGSRLRGLWRFMTLRPRGQAMALSAHVQIKHSLRDAVARQEISRRQGQIAYALAKQQIHAYVDAVCSASQLKGWERLFSLWHLVHLPFLYLLLFSGIVHVVAVHMY